MSNCPQKTCSSVSLRPKVVRFGSFFRTSDSRWIQRFRCLRCGRTFSRATGTPCFGQNKRRANEPLRRLLASGLSLRRAALLLHLHRITVVRKLRFLAEQSRLDLHRSFLQRPEIYNVQFDELETFEHAKTKPLSIVLAVHPSDRKILGFEVASMPAKGPGAEFARKKYGPRADRRSRALQKVFTHLKPKLHSKAVLLSDRNPRYPRLVARILPTVRHETVKGRRGCVTGQGELKRIAFDPLFSLNHTCAMLRANINRLFRKTWCTTKKASALADHLAIYAAYHNNVLT